MSQNGAHLPIAAFFVDGQKFDVRADSEVESYGSVDRVSFETIYLGSGKTHQKGTFVDSGCRINLSCNDAEEFESLKQLFKTPMISRQFRIEHTNGKQVSFSGKRTGELEAQENYAFMQVSIAYDSEIEVVDP